MHHLAVVKPNRRFVRNSAHIGGLIAPEPGLSLGPGLAVAPFNPFAKCGQATIGRTLSAPRRASSCNRAGGFTGTPYSASIVFLLGKQTLKSKLCKATLQVKRCSQTVATTATQNIKVPRKTPAIIQNALHQKTNMEGNIKQTLLLLHSLAVPD